MQRIAQLTPALAVTGALVPADFAEIARLGFKSVINNRVDGEEPGQLSSREEIELAQRAGLEYLYLPAAKHEVLDDHVVLPLADALATMPGPILLHCRSGLRSTIMWTAIRIDDGATVDEMIQAAEAAGQDLSALRDELADRAGQSMGNLTTADRTGCQAAA